MAFDHIVDVMEEVVKFTLLTRDVSGYLYITNGREKVKVAARLHLQRWL